MKRISSLAQYLELVSTYHQPEQWLFRGVDNADYDLKPSIGRVRHRLIPKEVGQQEEERALWRFKDRVRPYIGLRIENDLEWMVVAQHHGLPTRLLDWTRSPLVAIYFAATKIEKIDGKHIDGRVDIVRTPHRVSPANRKKPYRIDKVMMIDPPHVSERVTRQSGVLTIHPTPSKAWEPKERQSILVANEAKFEIKKQLDHLGINYGSLFPGVDGVAGQIKWELKWDRLEYGKPQSA